MLLNHPAKTGNRSLMTIEKRPLFVSSRSHTLKEGYYVRERTLKFMKVVTISLKLNQI